MKSQFPVSFRLVLLLVVGAFWSGCAQEAKESGQTQVAPTRAAPGATNVAAKTDTDKQETLPIRKIAATPVETSPAAAEVIKLSEAGVAESVVLGFISNSAAAYNLSVDEILYLYDIGISSQVITAMMRHDADLREKQGEASELGAQISDQQTNIMAELAGIKETLAKELPAAAPAAPETANAPAAAGPGQATAQAAPAPPQEAAPQPAYANLPQQVNYFYSDLTPYGSWYELPGYGWCWQPRVVVVNPAWRPYCDRGNWLWTDCGWYWQSDYSWGWAPFHYGRWHRHPSAGWVWFPDSCWAPAWVSWRYTDGYCGWAPLPPSAHFSVGVGLTHHGTRVGVDFGFGLGADFFTFVEWKHLHDHYPRQYALAHAQAGNVYKNSRVINNYIVGNNNTIINEGIGLKRVAAAAQGEIRKVEVRDLPAHAGQYVKPDRIERSGSSMVVYRPQFSELTRPKAGIASTRTPGGASYPLGGKTASGSSSLAPINKPSAERSSLAYSRTPYQPQRKSSEQGALGSKPSPGRYTPTTAGRPGSSGAGSITSPQRQEPARPVILKSSDSRSLPASTTPAPTYSAPKQPLIIRSTPRAQAQPSVAPPTYRSDPPRTTVSPPSYRAPTAPASSYQPSTRSYTPSYQAPTRSYTPSPAPSYTPSRPSYSSPKPSYSAPAPRTESSRVSSSPPASSSPGRSSPSPSPSRSSSSRER